MKQTLFKKYVYEGYVFNITVVLNSKLVEGTYIHEITTSGKDYFESFECTSDSLSETLDKAESNIVTFVNAKLDFKRVQNSCKHEEWIFDECKENFQCKNCEVTKPCINF